MDDLLQLMREAQERGSRHTTKEERMAFSRQLRERAAMTPTTKDGLLHLLHQSNQELGYHVHACLVEQTAWYRLALLCANATRLYGSRRRLYGILLFHCGQHSAEPPSERTFHRLVRLGLLLRKWKLEREHIFGLTWRQAFDLLTELDAATDIEEDDYDAWYAAHRQIRARLRQERGTLL